eukprot:3832679-Pyramimonas_sp.AAC.1
MHTLQMISLRLAPKSAQRVCEANGCRSGRSLKLEPLETGKAEAVCGRNDLTVHIKHVTCRESGPRHRTAKPGTDPVVYGMFMG